MLLVLLGCGLGGPFDRFDSGGYGTWDSRYGAPRVGGDTGFAWFFWAGAVAAPGGEFSAGYFGVTAFGEADGEFVCVDVGHLEEQAGGSGCAGCAFSFHFRVEGTSTEGRYCDSLGLNADGDFDGMELGLGWGPPSYSYAYNYETLTLYDPVYMYYSGEWFLFAYDYYNDYAEISGDYMRFIRPYFVTYGSTTYWLSGYYRR